METSDNIRFVFGLLDNINENIEAKSTDAQSYLNITEIRIIVDNNLKSKNYKFSNHGQRVVHFILYLNTELSNCEWVKEDTSLNLKRYVHGKPLSNTIYYKVVDVLNLKPFIFETIMCTPYSFCSDLIEIYSNKIKAMDGLSQLVATEKLIVALMKSIRRAPVKSNSESSVTNHFNQAMLVFGKDNLPHDIRRLDFEDEQKEITKYNGFRVKSIFNILIEIIKFKSIPDTYRLYPMYKLKSLRSSVPSTDTGHIMFKKFLDVIMYKCMNMCNFSIDTWLAWYEVEVVEEDTNLQATIGHLCYELCSLIDNGTINEPVLREFQPILRNIAIEKIDFSNVDTTNIDEMIKGVENSSRFHINSWIKKMIQNPDVFVHNNAIPVISHHIDCIDYNCFKAILDSVMAFYKNGGVVSEATGNLIFKGIKRLDVEDKMTVLKQFLVHYADCTFYISNEFDKQFHYVAHNEYNENIDQQELLSILIWLMMQQPKKILNLLIAQYITGICGLRPKGFDSKRSCLHQGMVSIHLYMDSSYIYQEYKNWFSIYSSLSDFEQGQLHQWILGVTKRLHFMKTETFLTHIIIPILNPSPDYCLLKYLTYLTKYLVEDCQIIVSHLHSWDKIVIQLATLLDHVRWDIHNYSPIRVEICESIISTIQPLLHHNIRSRSIDLGLLGRTVQNVKQRLSGLHLMTRSHFLRLWTSEYITIDGMDEQLIMTVHSQSHISYSNLNKSSTQRAQEEFIFSIATFMPKFTSYEMKSFIANYLSSAKPPNLVDASYFLLDCMMNSVMRIIVYLKTATQNESSDNRCEWNYVHRAIVDFFAAVNASKMCCIYDEDVNVSLAINTMTKIIMVIKQVADREMSSLTAMLYRLIEVTQSRMTVEEISKILSLLASIKAQDYKDSLKAIMQGLMDKLLHKKQLNVGKDNMCK